MLVLLLKYVLVLWLSTAMVADAPGLYALLTAVDAKLSNDIVSKLRVPIMRAVVCNVDAQPSMLRKRARRHQRS